MARNVFLDTNGWLSLLNSGDVGHQVADSIWRDMIRRGARLIVTDWVVAETGNGSARSRTRHRFVDAVQATLKHPRVELVIVDEALLQRALQHFARHADKSWGLVDCASFIVMRDRGISEAFTSDQHFEQAGFVRLLAL